MIHHQTQHYQTDLILNSLYTQNCEKRQIIEICIKQDDEICSSLVTVIQNATVYRAFFAHTQYIM